MLKLLNINLDVFGDVKAELLKEESVWNLDFSAPRVFMGSFISASGKVKFGNNFVYPEISLKSQGFAKTQGYL